jgi:hypothetical protein
MDILVGIDIGGVNIKCASISRDRMQYLNQETTTSKKYYPLWQHTLKDLHAELGSILADHVNPRIEEIDGDEPVRVITAASITGELSDAFASKQEGIELITAAMQDGCNRLAMTLRNLHPGDVKVEKPLYVSTDGVLRSREEAVEAYRLVSAANWHATSTWVGSLVPDAVLIDAGSTTIDIIPIVNGIPTVKGFTDLERLRSGELVYTGVLRATIPSISHHVPVNGEMVPVSFEKFAQAADVNFILGNITQAQYDCDTADNRSNSYEDSLKRLARTVCEDADVLGEEAIKAIAEFIYHAQIDQVSEGLIKVISWLGQEHGIYPADIPCVLTGLGEDVLARPATERAGFKEIVPLSTYIGAKGTVLSSAIGVLHVLSTHLDQVEAGAT